MALVIFFVGASAHAQVIILHVDKDQTSNPLPDGLSWPNAYPTLTAGIAEARARLLNGIPGDEVGQIWVAEGVYKGLQESMWVAG